MKLVAKSKWNLVALFLEFTVFHIKLTLMFIEWFKLSEYRSAHHNWFNTMLLWMQQKFHWWIRKISYEKEVKIGALAFESIP